MSDTVDDVKSRAVQIRLDLSQSELDHTKTELNLAHRVQRDLEIQVACLTERVNAPLGSVLTAPAGGIYSTGWRTPVSRTTTLVGPENTLVGPENEYEAEATAARRGETSLRQAKAQLKRLAVVQEDLLKSPRRSPDRARLRIESEELESILNAMETPILEVQTATREGLENLLDKTRQDLVVTKNRLQSATEEIEARFNEIEDLRADKKRESGEVRMELDQALTMLDHERIANTQSKAKAESESLLIDDQEIRIAVLKV